MATIVVSPPVFPAAVRRAFEHPRIFRRIARLSQWDSRSRLLELTGASAAMCWAQDLGCEAVVVDEAPEGAARLRQLVEAEGLQRQLEVRHAALTSLPFGEGDFDGIACFGRVVGPVSEAASLFRGLLAREGRLILTVPVRVGPSTVQDDLWGTPVPTPAEVLGSLQRLGFEPEGLETLGEAELQDLYARMGSASEVDARWQSLQPAIASRSKELGPVSLALCVARRREPGERPPVSRDRG